MKTEQLKQIKSTLCAALKAREDIVSELVTKGLAQRRSWGIDMRDTRHPKYDMYRRADSAYYSAFAAAKKAELIIEHNHSFSWTPVAMAL